MPFLFKRCCGKPFENNDGVPHIILILEGNFGNFWKNLRINGIGLNFFKGRLRKQYLEFFG